VRVSAFDREAVSSVKKDEKCLSPPFRVASDEWDKSSAFYELLLQERRIMGTKSTLLEEFYGRRKYNGREKSGSLSRFN
jgi:hypothetical protein